jgi:TonB family protein
MSEIWKQCEGEIVDNRFPLLQFLANTNHSAVFLTSVGEPEARKAVIKFISADIPGAEEQLAAWKGRTQLDHPHILRIFHSGRSHIAGLDILYVVMEQADEDLSRFLPKRALTAAETRDLLGPLVEALSYLHGKGLVHSHIKPSNLLASKDRLRLSSDTIFPVGRSRETHRDLDAYDAPENSATPLITATFPADVWSLGVTLVEALTQQVPALPFEDSAEMALSETIPEPFLDIAQRSVVRDPAQRWTISQISEHLNPAPLAAAASASVTSTVTSAAAEAALTTEAPVRSPVVSVARVSSSRVPSLTEPTIQLAKPRSQSEMPLRRKRPRAETTIALPSYVIPIVLLSTLAVGAILAVPKFFHPVSEPAATASNSRATSAKTKTNPSTAAKPAPTESMTKTPAGNTPQAANEQKKNVAPGPATAPIPAQDSAQSAGLVYANSSKNGTVRKSSASSADRGEVLEQVLPQAPAKALSSIHGTVRVVVGVQVDAAGNVSSSRLDSAGPSKYFADLAQQAAEQWQFSSPVSDGRSLPSQWAIRFEFSGSGVVAIPTQHFQ